MIDVAAEALRIDVLLTRSLLALESAAAALGDALERRHVSHGHLGDAGGCLEQGCASTRAAMQYARASVVEIRSDRGAEVAE